MKGIYKAFIIAVVTLIVIGMGCGYHKFSLRVEKINPYPLTNIHHSHNDTIKKIVIIGDSWGDWADKFNVPDFIDSLMLENGVQTRTMAKGEHGATSKTIYKNMHAGNQNANSTQALMEDNPQYAVLFCGINDSHGQYGKGFYAYHTTLIIQEMLHRKIKPVVLELPYYDIKSQYEHYYGFTRRCAYTTLALLTDHTIDVNNIDRYRAALKEHLSEKKIDDKIIWISADSLSKQECYGNNMHLNIYGYECLANIIVENILADIKKNNRITI
ncbi:MAG: SGNH/GDSL hydrolase family protein [Prevotella sp.]|nr:SGNH/GDSL hydrolase family protein [Prevotella sp.]MBO5156241.1 SGNH/GDSL hydrolase family protein [Prevotella sp.]MBO5204614.1 SGNH/GDSL hydrolase family protein [Prevotella sp.]